MNYIYKSFLDNDNYKFSMGAFFWHYYKGTPVEYAYKCRDPKINLQCIYDDLLLCLGEFTKVFLQKDEKKWLFENTRVTQDYLVNFLSSFSFNPSQVSIKRISDNPGLDIRVKGPIEQASLWEMPLMSLISELYFRRHYGKNYGLMVEAAKNDLCKKLEDLLAKISYDPNNTDIKFLFSEFGTRRRLSFDFQDYAVELLNKKLPHCLVGTSNMYFAKKHGIKAVGTQAHEAFLLYQGLVHPEDSQKKFLKDWIEYWRGFNGIALTDSLGPRKWDRDFTKNLMIDYTGQRHDSGDPYAWAEERIAAYKREGIDPKEKTLLFSDNLTFDKALDLTLRFGDRINVSHGIGTHITNHIPSMPDHKALNQVIKLVRVNGRPVAKLSDDPMKAQCEDPIFLEYMRHISK
jgi:nicotinate phosphoribosyltransferase